MPFDMQVILRWLLAIILVWAALGKIANLQAFYASLTAYHLPLPDALLRLAVTALPWLELLCGILLIAEGARRAALLWTVVLFAAFVLATGQAWARGLEISCGCIKLDFLGDGAAKKALESVQFAFIRAILLLGAALYLAAKDRTPPRSPGRRVGGNAGDTPATTGRHPLLL
jgi:uncharacterized membrane protein YphA (DoxX/SURF4 family)